MKNGSAFIGLLRYLEIEAWSTPSQLPESQACHPPNSLRLQYAFLWNVIKVVFANRRLMKNGEVHDQI